MAVTQEAKNGIADVRRSMQHMSDAQTRELVGAWVEAWDTLIPDYQASIDSLMLQAVDGKVSPAKVRANTRLRRALETTEATLEALSARLVEDTARTLPEAIRAGFEGSSATIAAQLPVAAASIVSGWDRVNPEALDAIVTRSTQQIHSSAKHLAPDAVNRMKKELVRGISTGGHPEDTARRIIKQAEGRFNGGLNRALTIARTETLDAHRAGSLASSKENADILKGWAWDCDFSERTCPACLSKHGEMFPTEAPGPEGHPNCRCARRDVTKSWKELGFDDIEEPEPDKPSAQDWYEGLTPSSQAEIMGTARRDLLASGDIKWDNLATKQENPSWRPSWQVTPLRDLTK